MNQRFFTMNPPFPPALHRHQVLPRRRGAASTGLAPGGESRHGTLEIFPWEKMGFPWGFPWEHHNETWLMMVNDG